MGMPAVPLDQFVLKVHSRCDLACDHCYVYEAADQSWRGRQKVIPGEVLTRSAQRIAEHATKHGLRSVQVVLHGGEPLLAGVDGLRRIITELRSSLRGICQLDLRIHTNGVRLNHAFCALFAEYDVRVGISIDGDKAANDRHRRFADGRSSYDQVVRAIGLLRTDQFRRLYAGLLCTIDVTNDPVAVYEALMALGPPRVDFLLPHATWDAPPPRAPGRDSEYADWLIAIFDRWLADGRPTKIRTFESILSTLRDGDSYTEALGLAPSSLAVIETDGSYEQVDSLKVAYDGAAATGLNVFSDALDAVVKHPGIVARQQGVAGLCTTCQECPVLTSCGGGLYAHRYQSAAGFDNPSVYCPDLLKLITSIKARLPGPIATHTMPDGDFLELAAGLGGAASVTRLIEGQRTLRRALVTAVCQDGSSSPVISDRVQVALRATWEVLAAADRRQPEALDAVLGHPYVRVWAARCLERLRAPEAAATYQGGERRARGLAADLRHLGALAAATAIRAGQPAEVTVPVVDAAVHLPTLGRLILEPDRSGLVAGRLLTDGDAIHLRVGESYWKLAISDLLSGEPRSVTVGGDGRPADWRPVRMLRAPGICVALEDSDPYRDCYQWRAASPLGEAEFARWQRSFQGAWQEVQTRHAALAPAMAAGLRVLMPLSPGPDGRDVSGAERNAFGAVATVLPADPVTLAGLIVREFQRVKFAAVLDLYDLCDPADARLYPVPWGKDARLLGELLQDTYVHLAVEPAPAGVMGAIETLIASGSLTAVGLRFVEAMRESVNRRPRMPYLPSPSQRPSQQIG